jgi:hypothetical protein
LPAASASAISAVGQAGRQLWRLSIPESAASLFCS